MLVCVSAYTCPMDHRDAVDLLRNAPMSIGRPQHWADLGCGTGTFTRALAELLPTGSTIAAMDHNATAVKQVPDLHGNVQITKHVGDFVTEPLAMKDLDGILLANALHFVRDQAAFIQRISTSLKPTGALLLVEYDTGSPNPWVPHPLSFVALSQLCADRGFGTVQRLGERTSAFGGARLYSVWVGRGVGRS